MDYGDSIYLVIAKIVQEDLKPSRSQSVRKLRRSSNACTTANTDGTKLTVSSVDPSIPVSTAMPMDFSALAPAPVASTSGTTPRMKASEVTTISRNRERAASY